MNLLRLYMEADGEEAGKLELVSTPVKKARDFAEEILGNVDESIPDFDKNYKLAQKNASKGWTKRKDMPVIRSKDVEELQRKLKAGELDVKKPFASDNKGNPFPEGLTGKEAEEWLKSGLKDGSLKDDIIKVTKKKVALGDLFPIQEQIYADKAIKGMVKSGSIESTLKFLNKTFFITSNDNYILDGHHRYLTGLLLDPSLKVNTLSIDLDIETLLKLTVSYGDAVGNKRNK